jgi:hypothetical protein
MDTKTTCRHLISLTKFDLSSMVQPYPKSGAIRQVRRKPTSSPEGYRFGLTAI